MIASHATSATDVEVSTSSLASSPSADAAGPAALLRGGARGLEIVVDSRASLGDIVGVLTTRLGEAPGFFRGSDVRVRFEHGPLPVGTLARLDELAAAFELRIVEVGALVPPPAKRDDAVPRPNLAHGSAPAAAETAAAFTGEKATLTRAPLGLPVEVIGTGPEHDADTVIPEEPAMSRAITQEMTPALAAQTVTEFPRVTIEPSIEEALESPTTRVVVGPVRSGVILDHPGHLFVFGDVNPGAEVRAEGNIVILGRLRGTAHAGIGNDSGFILALRLEPQQLRICRQVARAGDSDAPNDAEIAYVTDASIVVERYAGRLPKNLAASL